MPVAWHCIGRRPPQDNAIKTILMPVGGSDADTVVLETALVVAEPLSAHLELVHVSITAPEAALHTPHVELARGVGLWSALRRPA